MEAPESLDDHHFGLANDLDRRLEKEEDNRDGDDQGDEFHGALPKGGVRPWMLWRGRRRVEGPMVVLPPTHPLTAQTR
ncbi:MAG: hypothetical protein AMXMBFR55_02380 [Gemmatimonadota bacterium]